jgi:hypothetical protein
MPISIASLIRTILAFSWAFMYLSFRGVQCEEVRMAIGNPERERKPLSVTIGPEFGKVGGKGIPGTDVQSQVVRLTGAAEQYLKRGQSALAFDSLMEAYLLDPLNPLVLSCEKNVLPAWEAFRTKQTSPGLPPSARSDEERLARLRAERDVTRREKERKVWEQASSAPRVLSQKPGTPPPKPGKPTL